MRVGFEVPGQPQPQGSKSVNRETGQMFEQNARLMPWREQVAWYARRVMNRKINQGRLITGAVRVTVEFRLARPPSHYGTGRNAAVLRPGAPEFPKAKPDLDKMQRGLGDALKVGGVLADDAQIVDWHARKRYTGHGVAGSTLVVVETLPLADPSVKV